MNALLDTLQPYPFERLRQLFAQIIPSAEYSAINLGIGEPKHATPQCIQDALCNATSAMANYPSTTGDLELRHSFTDWLARRYDIVVDANTQVLPVNGSREALFAFAQAVIDSTHSKSSPSLKKPLVVCPNPFYQIYEGAALLAGATPFYVASEPSLNFGINWGNVPAAIWRETQLLFVCSPGNPAGAVMDLAQWAQLFALSDEHGFSIASDECYSEIYAKTPPLGGLEAASKLGRLDFKNLVSFTSLSKRSNVPGLRSGFCAGDANLMRAFTLYRTYHGSAMSPVVQAASKVAWQDEVHVQNNRVLYREKFSQVTPLLASVLQVTLPDAGFYLWAKIPDGMGLSDAAFAQHLLKQYNVTVLPGSYLARSVDGINAGAGYIRLALVADAASCLTAAQRIVDFVTNWKSDVMSTSI